MSERSLKERIVQLEGELEKRKTAEMALFRGEQCLRSILESSPIGVGIFRNSDRVMSYVNSKCSTFFGCQAPFEMLGLSLQDFWQDPTTFDRFAAKSKNVNPAKGSEVKLKTISGQTYWTMVSFDPISIDKEECTLFWIYDISEQKKAEEEIKDLNESLERKVEERTIELKKSRNDAESANKAKSEFLASMSHELRTPMNAVLGFAELLKVVGGKNPLGEKQSEWVDNIITGGSHLLELINDVLDLAKIEADQIRLNITEVELKKSLDYCSSITKALSGAVGLNISTQCNCGEEIKLKTDEVRLNQILINLLSNAVKYNVKGGSIIILCEERQNNFLRISVIDSGVGIKESSKQNIFEIFTRLGLNPDITNDGAGIGLYVAKLLVEKLSGRIGFKSEEGKGSTFWIELPLWSN